MMGQVSKESFSFLHLKQTVVDLTVKVISKKKKRGMYFSFCIFSGLPSPSHLSRAQS